jgi:hypothetical protein
MRLNMNSPRSDLFDELASVYARAAVDAFLAQQGCVRECSETATTGANLEVQSSVTGLPALVETSRSAK